MAFHRGVVVAQKRTWAGTMAAIGLGWATVEPFLVPGVIRDCDNAPRSVTFQATPRSLGRLWLPSKKLTLMCWPR